MDTSLGRPGRCAGFLYSGSCLRLLRASLPCPTSDLQPPTFDLCFAFSQSVSNSIINTILEHAHLISNPQTLSLLLSCLLITQSTTISNLDPVLPFWYLVVHITRQLTPQCFHQAGLNYERTRLGTRHQQPDLFVQSSVPLCPKIIVHS